MGRRSDHDRNELRDMIVNEGHRQIAEVGYAQFSARKVAKRIGYSIGTLYNIFGTLDNLILAINGLTLDMWREHLDMRLSDVTENRLKGAVEAYFEFAILHRNSWSAIYEFRLPDVSETPEGYGEKVIAITQIIIDEITSELPKRRKEEAPVLARSLLATVHGHCVFALNGTFNILGEIDPIEAAVERVYEAIK